MQGYKWTGLEVNFTKSSKKKKKDHLEYQIFTFWFTTVATLQL